MGALDLARRERLFAMLETLGDEHPHGLRPAAGLGTLPGDAGECLGVELDVELAGGVAGILGGANFRHGLAQDTTAKCLSAVVMLGN
jgi:hypothetical protein